MNDGTIHRLFLTLPRRCIVVIEDIDSAGIGREQAPSQQPEASSAPPELAALLSGTGLPLIPSAAGGMTDRFGRDARPRNTVTLSGLLNAIDGNASQEGRLLIMTSNNPDALDKALVRPGRVDRKVYFGNMTKSAGKSIFKRLIGRSAIAHDAAFTMDQIEQYADEFSEKVPANTLTPADVQNYLQGCRGDPVKALSDIDAWIVEHRGKTAAGESRRSETPSFVLRPEETDGIEADLV
jgi:chaperone BCS1